MPSRKRLSLLIAGLVLAAGCSGERADPARTPQAAPSGWAIPPQISTVTRAAGGLTVSGHAGPNARVVLRGADDAAFAASADETGRFDIRMNPPAGDALLTPETQTGQDAAPAPERLLVLNGGQGPIALLTPGGGSVRLDGSGPLGAVDSDGRMLALSGQAAPGESVRVTIGGRVSIQVQADASGRWTATGGGGPGAVSVTVGERAYDYPGEAGASTQATRAGAGWRLAWAGPGGARQVTWLPD